MPSRKRGGQPGNTNAVTHGRYSAATRPDGGLNSRRCGSVSRLGWPKCRRFHPSSGGVSGIHMANVVERLGSLRK
jgi:hypothetical protein